MLNKISVLYDKNKVFLWSLEKINLKFKEKFGSYAKVSMGGVMIEMLCHYLVRLLDILMLK
jgi:hypothetical protein